MKCIIIEDELPAQKILIRYIEKTVDLECLGAFRSVQEMSTVILEEVDLLFLDIQLPGVNGLDFLKSLEKKPKVIITSAYRDYAIDAFEEAVEDYLLKPFGYNRFLKAIIRVQTMLYHKNNINDTRELFVYTDKAFHKISREDIFYIRSEVDYVSIVYGEKKLMVQDSMNNWEEKLKHHGFIRIHRSFIINFSKIDKVEGNLVYINKLQLPIGKTYRSSFFDLIKS